MFYVHVLISSFLNHNLSSFLVILFSFPDQSLMARQITQTWIDAIQNVASRTALSCLMSVLPHHRGGRLHQETYVSESTNKDIIYQNQKRTK